MTYLKLVTINKAEERGVCEEEDSGELYLLGQTWKPDDCTQCECGRDGIVSCAVQSCEGQIPDCERPVRENGQCCPVCKEVEGTFERNYPNICHAFFYI